MSPVVYSVLKSVILPPGSIIIIALIGIILVLRRVKAGLYLVIFSVTVLYVFSTPVFSGLLVSTLEPEYPLNMDEPGNERAVAIVVLGCGRYPDAPEYAADDISECSLMRLRYAMELLQHKQLPVLLSGGSVYGEQASEAMIMEMILNRHFQRHATWLEGVSKNTFENAKFSSVLLKQQNIDTVYLVTHAIHMKRASLAFERHMIEVVPAPTYFYSLNRSSRRLINYLPSMHALTMTSAGLHEILGIIWQEYINR